MLLAAAMLLAAGTAIFAARASGAPACIKCPGRRGACRFQFGAFFRKDAPPAHMRTAAYQTVWLGTRSKSYGYGFNPYWHGRMLERVHALNRTAVYYSYLIAMLARHTKGIKDCDVGTPSLCVHGADFVRQHEGLILRTYEQYANETALVLGRSAPVVWLMEPDWHQYGEATQRGGGVPQSRMVQLFVAMVGRIKRHLPAALISFDVSPGAQPHAVAVARSPLTASADRRHCRRTAHQSAAAPMLSRGPHSKPIPRFALRRARACA
jgi:hypothetical protein